MSGALEANGAVGDKPPRFSDIYTGRQFSGIWTNRSPLRDAQTTRIIEKFYGPNGDAIIAGSNVEVSNRLTLIRRPGNPIYDNVNTYTDVLSFDTFRVSKPLSDIFGETSEDIYTMVDTAADLYAEDSGFNRELVWVKTPGAGQSYMVQVGDELYFGNGIDNQKWLQSLFVRDIANDSTAINTDSYPFMDTYLIDPNGNIQQMIGTWISTVSNVAVTGDVITLTVTAPATTQPTGTQFMLWGFTNPATVSLNGITITLNAPWSGTTLTAICFHPNLVSTADTAYVQIESGGSPVTGGSVPTWNTQQPQASNDFAGGITLDGTVIWVNRGINYAGTPNAGSLPSVENWGIAAPDEPLTFTASGSSIGWQASTYYSIASIYANNGLTSGTTHGYLWQITTAGKTGATEPTWPATPTPSKKIDIINVAISGANVVTFKTETQSLSAGNVVNIEDLAVATFLNGASLTVLSSGLTTTQFEANYVHPTYAAAADYGIAILPGTTQADGAAVWTCIQSPASLIWAAHTHYRKGDYLLNPVGTGSQYFQLGKVTQPFISTQTPTVPGGFTPPSVPVMTYGWNGNPAFAGQFDKAYPQTSADFTLTTCPALNNISNTTGVPPELNQDMYFFAVNGAGEIGAGTDSGHYEEWEAAYVCNLFIPAPGQYTFTLQHDDGAYFSFDQSTGAYRVLGTGTNILAPGQTVIQGYANCTGNNVSGLNTDSGTWNFPTAGNYGLEINWKNWQNESTMIFTCNGQTIASYPDESGTNQPAWPTFTTSGATWNPVLDQIIFGSADTVQEAAKQYLWSNIGPVGDFTWNPVIEYTLAGTQIVDTNSNEEGSIETGVSGITAPVWSTTPNAVTADNPNLKWINEGPVPIQPNTTGKITATSAQGFIYALALVNTLDNTVSNIGPLSLGTGPITSGQVTFAPGAGLPTTLSDIDPQADYVAIFRTTDGESTELLIPSNGNTQYTVPLTQYLLTGYVDTTPDTGLDTLIQAAASGENTPPLPGAVNLAYHLNRIWYSIGNTVYYTTGPLAPVGNGINGTAPLDYDNVTSLVKRLVPTSIGIIIFTVSDIYIIQTSAGNIYPSLPYCPRIGISNYNALDVNGPEIGFFTTDHQFLIMSPSGGMGQAQIPIADQFQLQNGLPGQNWNPNDVYVSHYVNGQDVAWFVADGSQGWYKLIPTPAPEGPGVCWSPFAAIEGGVGAIKSVETSPGVHALLLGPTGTGKILMRSMTAVSDGGTTSINGTPYPAYAVFGSYVLAQPGKIAQVAFIATRSVNVGTPLVIGLLIDEALPYYTGSFEILRNWTNDPPGLPQSKSLIGQRFYLSELPDSAAAMQNMQLMIQWAAEAAPNELNSFSIYGCILNEN